MGLFSKGRLRPARLKLELITGGVSAGIDRSALLSAAGGMSALVAQSTDSPYELVDAGRGREVRLNGVGLLGVKQTELSPEPGIEDRLGELRVLTPRESCAVKREAACSNCPFLNLVHDGDPGPDALRVSQKLNSKHRFLRVETCCPDQGAMKRIRAILRKCVTPKGPVGVVSGAPEHDSVELRLLKSAGAQVLISPAWARSGAGFELVRRKGGLTEAALAREFFEATGVEIDFASGEASPASRLIDEAFNQGMLPRLVARSNGAIEIVDAVELVRRQARGYSRTGWTVPRGFSDWSADALPPREVFEGLSDDEKRPSGGKRPPPGVVYFL